MNVHEFIQEKAVRLKDRTMITVVETDEKYSFEEFNNYSNKSANLLLDLQIKKGDKVSIICQNRIEYLFIFFGCLKIGAVLNPINPRLTEKEYDYILKDAGSKLVFTECCEKIKCFNAYGLENLKKELDTYDTNFPKQDINGEDDALLMYSSGTTGNPKGIILTQGNILFEAEALAKHFSYNEKTVFMINLPLFFSGGTFPCFFGPLYGDASFILIEKFSKSKFWKTIDKYKVTNTFCVPTMLSILLNPPEDISVNMDFICSGAAYVAPELIRKFESTFGVKIYILYGLTENSAICSATPYNKERKIESIGVPLPGVEMKIFDNNDKELLPYKEGEIVIRGLNVTWGYHNKPEATKEALKNGWLYSGDIGYMDKEGYFYYTSRKKELIIKGGENISPVQIDEIFYKHPNVADCATIGVPDEIYGEEIVTYVIPRQGKQLNKEELLNFCKKHISEFKCPKEIIITNEIPKTASGKLMRRKLVERYQNEMG